MAAEAFLKPQYLSNADVGPPRLFRGVSPMMSATGRLCLLIGHHHMQLSGPDFACMAAQSLDAADRQFGGSASARSLVSSPVLMELYSVVSLLACSRGWLPRSTSTARMDGMDLRFSLPCW